MLACNHRIKFFSISMIFFRFQFLFVFLKSPLVDQPTVDNGEVRRGRSVAVVIIVNDKGHMTHET